MLKTIICILLLESAALAQDCPTENCAKELIVKRSLKAISISGQPPVIDGRLDEPVWRQAPVADRFVETRPQPGTEAQLKTEVRVVYDDAAIYIGMRMYQKPEMILGPFVRRDDEINCDWAFVEVDSRHDYRSGFSFGLNPVGVQADGAWLNDTDYDGSWDGVWEGASTIDSEGWTSEFRIPFSQLPYETDSSNWGVNFYRNSPMHGETSVWSPRLPWRAGIVSHFNDLYLETPGNQHRVEIKPFTASEFRNETNDHVSIRGGTDIKLWLGSAFLISAAAFPDFGQIEADPDQLNLTTFELFQTERRPFFIQGMDAFRFDSSLNFVTRGNSFLEETPFYSRRIGRAPRGQTPDDATVMSLPGASTILAAVKLTGQTSNGWNIGAFTATTQKEHAVIEDLQHHEFDHSVEPMTQTELVRIIKATDQNKSSYGFIFSNTTNFGFDEDLVESFVHNAFLGGIDGRIRFHSSEYEIGGWFLTSFLTGDQAAVRKVTEQPHHFFQRPDANYLHDLGTDGSLYGYAAQSRLSRIAGRMQWDVIGEVISPGYDSNEIGFQRNSDWFLLAGTWKYEVFQAGHLIRHWAIGSDRLGLGWNFAGELRAQTINGFVQLDTRNYWKFNARWLHDFSSLSVEWLRGGPALLLPGRDLFQYSILTDQRRASYAQLDGSWWQETGSESKSWMLNPQIFITNGLHLRWSLGLSYQEDQIGWQYVTNEGTDYFVARDQQKTVSPTLRADWAFSPHLILQVYAQPFVSSGRFDHYQLLVDPRALENQDRFGFIDENQIPGFSNPDNTNRTSNANVILRWEFRPGSFLTAVWNHRSDVTIPIAEENLTSQLGSVFSDAASDVFLIKFSYHFS